MTLAESYHFARLLPDGRLTSPLPHAFATKEAAKAAAPDLLRNLRANTKIVLVQILEEVSVECKVVYRGFGKP